MSEKDRWKAGTPTTSTSRALRNRIEKIRTLTKKNNRLRAVFDAMPENIMIWRREVKKSGINRVMKKTGKREGSRKRR